ncbi:MAG: hypothetical protein R3B70_27395 [Polyangiaceae bacterium]
MPKKTSKRKASKAPAPKPKGKAKVASARKPPAAKAKKPAKPAAKPAAKARPAKPAPKPARPAKAAKAKVKAKPVKGKGKSGASSRGLAGALAAVTAPTEAVIRDEKGGTPLKRKLGLRGAAPWAARHAAKHAAEARARAAQPAPPGSARATIRVPPEAEQIKAKITELYNQTQKIRTLRKRLDRGFFEIGEILSDIQQHDLHQAKGYGSFEAFLEREIDLGKQTSLKLIKISHTFQREAALDYGMDRLIQALAALEGELLPKAAPSAPGSVQALPLKPPMRIVGGGV